MSDIFVSYEKKDRERVGALVEALEELGWSVFWDRTIPPGQTWRDFIGEKLKEAGSVVVAWSESSVESTWVLEEAEFARNRQPSVLIPVCLEKVKLPLGFTGIHAVDLSDFDGRPEDPSFATLVDGLRRLLGDPPKQQQPTGYDDSIVDQVAGTLAAAEPLTAPIFARSLDRLFRRMTFREPLRGCPNQAWGDRLHAALQTWKLLDDDRYYSFLEESAGGQRETYGQMVHQVYRYCDYMLAYLFEGSLGLDSLRTAAGDNDAFRAALPAARSFEDLDTNTGVAEADSPRALAGELMDELLAGLSKAG